MQVSTAEFRKGLRIVFDGEPYTIVDFQHVKPGKGGAFVRTKLKHMRQGRVIDNTFRSGEKVELVDFEDKHMQFLYKDDRFHFMDMETYDQVSLSEDEVGDAALYLKDNTEVEVLYIDGSPVSLELPNFIELAVARTDPDLRRDTAQGGTKPATLETGAVVQVPLFLNAGAIVKLDTRTGEYLGGVATPGYRGASPATTEPDARGGAVVQEGRGLCIIEAMKLMTEIESQAAGRIEKILVENGLPVEYGQPLLLIEPAG